MDRPAKRFWIIAKYLFAVAIVIGVGYYFFKIFRDPNFQIVEWTFRPWPLFLAGCLYLVAHTIWGTFWWQLLKSQGAEISWFAGVRAYFVSQLGKYVPGKVWVIVMRVGLLDQKVSRPVVAVTGIYETLVSMAAGAGLGAILFPYLTGGQHIIRGGALPLVTLACVPIFAGLLNPFVNKLINKRRQSTLSTSADSDLSQSSSSSSSSSSLSTSSSATTLTPIQLPSPPIWLLIVGILQACLGWCLLALSFGLIVQGVVPDPPPLTGISFFQHLAVTTIMYVAGFVVLFAPGGVGARELILQQAMTPVLRASAGDGAAGLAAVVAIVVRLVWTIAELLCIAVLWFAKAYNPARQLAAKDEETRSV